MRRRSGIATAALGAIVAVIIVIAAVAAYVELANPGTVSSVTTSSISSTTTSSSQATTTTSNSPSSSTTSSISSFTTTTSTASVNTTCLLSMSSLTPGTEDLSASASPQDVLSLLGTYSSMAILLNETTSGVGNSSSPFVYSYAYDTVYVSATTYKVNVTVGAGSLGNFTETFWILRDGSLLADYIAESGSGGTSIPGTNLTGSSDPALVGSTFSLFQEEAHPTNLTTYTNPAMFHVSGTSTEDIGKIQMNVNTYVANTLPETLSQCGVSVNVSAYTLQLGTPQGSNASLLVSEHLVASDEINGTTFASDVDLRLLTIAAATAPPTTSGVWTYGNPYPLEVGGGLGISDQYCLNQTSTIFCIGGIGNNNTAVDDIYSASVTSSGMGAWTPEAPYPIAAGLTPCLTYTGYVYCIGGLTGDGETTTAAAYFAPLTSSGIGTWQSTTSYPVPIFGEACAASSGYIYCVAGENATDGTNATMTSTNSAWYAQISSSGIGTWQKTTAYPQGIQFPVCTPTATEFYCFGGFNANFTGVDNVYYASFTSSGIGVWKNTTSYPLPLEGEYCIVDSGDMACVGGSPNGTSTATQAFYYAPIMATGLGSWQQGPNYPVPINTSCVFAVGNVYCIGGLSNPSDFWSDFVFYAPVESLLG